MLLSVERPSGRPSCSSSSLQACSALKRTADCGAASASPSEAQTPDPAGNDFSYPHPQPPSPSAPRFSIRDYALSSRSKDIKKSWPFNLKYLKCLLKHNIHHLLPPFEPPDLVRISSSTRQSSTAIRSCVRRKVSSSESDCGQREAGSLLDTQQNVHESANGIQSNPLILKSSVPLEEKSPSDESISKGDERVPHSSNDIRYRKTVTESTVTCNGSSERSNPTSKPSCSLPSLGKTRISKDPVKAESGKVAQREKQVTSKEPSAKKCRLVVKVSATLDTKRGDEVSLSSTMVSDSMASKVCPVCKTFSSTSNTTLNAHIDQCLSMEPEVNCITDTTTKHRLKPMKKRLMVDIYTTALRCTLEDLDKRNGTNWATDPTLSLPVRNVTTDNNTDRSPPDDHIGSVNEKSYADDYVSGRQDGAVCFDANGTKVCILSRLNAVAPITEGQITKSRKLGKEPKKQIRSACGKQGRHIPLHPKSVKLKADGKRFCSLKLLKDEVPTTSTSNNCALEGERDGLQELWKKSQVKLKPSEPRSAGHRSFSNLPRRSGNDVKSCSPSVQNSLVPSSSVLSVSAKSKNLVLKISHPTDDSNGTTKIKCVKILSDSPPSQDTREMKSPHISETSDVQCSMGGSPCRARLRPRLSRPWGSRSFSRSQKKRILSQKSGKLARLHAMKNENWRQAKGSKSLGKSLPPTDKCKGKNLHMVSKMLKKHRSVKRSHLKEKRENSMAENAFHGCHGKDMVPTVSEDLENFMNSHTGSLVNQSCEQSKVVQSQLEMEDVCMNGVNDNSTRSYFEGASSGSQVVNLGYQTQCLNDVGAATRSYMENVSDPRSSIEPAHCGGPMVTSSSSLESWSRLVENVNFIGGKESLGEPLAPRLFNHQTAHCGANGRNEDVITSMEMACQQEIKLSHNSCSGIQYVECQMNTAPVLSDYATSSSNDMSHMTDVPQGNSSVTSNKITYNDGHIVVVDSAPSDTPESGASIISDPVEESNREDSARPVVEGDSVLGFSDVMVSGYHRNACDSRGENTEIYKMTSSLLRPGYWGNRENCSDGGNVSIEAPRQCSSAGLTSVSGSDLQQTNNFSSCSNELAVTGDCRNSVARGQQVEENAQAVQPIPCSGSRLTDQNNEFEPRLSPNPVFRLMGKNLLVPRKDVEHADSEKVDCSQESACTIRSFQPQSSPYNYAINPRSFDSPHYQVPEKWRDMVQFPLRPLPNGQQAESFSPYHFQNVHKAAECDQAYQNWPSPENIHFAYHGVRSALPCRCQKCMAIGQSPNHTNPMIILDDSLESKVEASLLPNAKCALYSTISTSDSQQANRLSCNPSHYAVEMGEMPLQLRPGLHYSYATSDCIQSRSGWSPSMGSGPPNSSFVVPSLPSSNLTHSLYYFPSMR